MASLDERITQLEKDLAEAKQLKQWQGLGQEFEDAFRLTPEESTATRVEIALVDGGGEYLADWKVPYSLIREEFSRMGASIKKRASAQPANRAR